MSKERTCLFLWRIRLIWPCYSIRKVALTYLRQWQIWNWTLSLYLQKRCCAFMKLSGFVRSRRLFSWIRHPSWNPYGAILLFWYRLHLFLYRRTEFHLRFEDRSWTWILVLSWQAYRQWSMRQFILRLFHSVPTWCRNQRLRCWYKWMLRRC